MDLIQEFTDNRKPFFLSLIINVTLGLVVYAMISFVQLQYLDSFWTNWVLFVSGLTIAFMVWNRIDPHKGDKTINGWITRGAGIVTFFILAIAIGF